MIRPVRLLVLALALAGTACGRSDDGALKVAIIGETDQLFEDGVLLSPAGQHVHAAIKEGLVGLDADGRVTPALADRWAFVEDGRSFIFRLRDGTWADGTPLTSENVTSALRSAIRRLRGTSLGYDLAQIAEVRAMAARVIEIRLKGPMPDILQLLAQPELGLTRKDQGVGPMDLRRVGDEAVLSMKSPEARGLPAVESWRESVRELRVHAMAAKQAIDAFDEGELDVVLNGRIETLPLVEFGPLSRGTIRLDPALGLFGLMVRETDGPLGDAALREAISMAIDRDRLIVPFGVGGWSASTRIVAPGLAADLGTIGERWTELPITDRRATAAQRVAAWKAAHEGDALELSVALPQGPGGNTLFAGLSRDMAAIGIALRRVNEGEAADLELVDRVARYPNAVWFLNQFNCGLRRSLCSPEADARVAEAVQSADPAERARLLAEAEAELTGLNGFIPFGSPVRWSLVRAGVNGFGANAWAFHPLSALAMRPR